MYVTRPLSHYIKNPESLSLQPEGPSSGFLVVQDEESETTSCFGLCKNRFLMDLPFPQNKELTVRYASGAGENRSVQHDDVFFIPVLNKPLSSNRYYVVKAHGAHKGEAYGSSGEEDKVTCCFCRCIGDVKPRPLDPRDISQQFEVFPYETKCSNGGDFCAKSVAPDKFPPSFLRKKGWQVYTKTPKYYELGEASGVNSALRAQLPEFNFPLSVKTSKAKAITVGKWYCPFVFIKEGTPGDQMKRSMFYEMTLEQSWEQIYGCENKGIDNAVVVDVVVEKEVASVSRKEAVWDERNAGDGDIWFRTSDGSVGLSVGIVERMKWEEGRVGWVGGEKRKVRVERREEFGGGQNGKIGGWKRFGCYLLVERFVLKRVDGSIVMTYEFKHTHQIRTKWESDY